MRILGYAVFWRRKGWKQAFHADVSAATPWQAAEAFLNLFPDDRVVSVRDKSGKFCAYRIPSSEAPRQVSFPQ